MSFRPSIRMHAIISSRDRTGTAFTTSGLAKRDDDGDGEVNEDGYDDLDGDGNITFMRIKDPNGRFKTDPSDKRLMVQAGNDEKGEYTLLGWEGIDNDQDGSVNEDNPLFHRPNRDWAWNWAPRYIQGGSDHYPFTFPEPLNKGFCSCTPEYRSSTIVR